MSACDRCRDLGLYSCTELGACRRATPEAEAKIESRTGQTRPEHSELQPVFDAEVLRRHPPRYGWDFEGFTSILKQRYSERSWRGTYAQESVWSGLQSFDYRLHRLRRTKLRDADTLAKRAGCKPYNWRREWDAKPFYALIRKDAKL